MAEAKEVVSTLNDLLETSIDGEEGFRKAADAIEDPTLKQYFIDRSKEVSIGVNELQTLVQTYGGEPIRTSSLAGTLHRRWIDLKAAITSNDTVAVLNEAERGEDVALANYRKAAQKDLPENVRSVVERQLEGVLRNHNRVKQLRDAARESAH
ncbi:MAG TPA: PA2169 family four-helix-bundle protein [Methyloradius sp.]